MSFVSRNIRLLVLLLALLASLLLCVRFPRLTSSAEEVAGEYTIFGRSPPGSPLSDSFQYAYPGQGVYTFTYDADLRAACEGYSAYLGGTGLCTCVVFELSDGTIKVFSQFQRAQTWGAGCPLMLSGGDPPIFTGFNVIITASSRAAFGNGQVSVWQSPGSNPHTGVTPEYQNCKYYCYSDSYGGYATFRALTQYSTIYSLDPRQFWSAQFSVTSDYSLLMEYVLLDDTVEDNRLWADFYTASGDFVASSADYVYNGSVHSFLTDAELHHFHNYSWTYRQLYLMGLRPDTVYQVRCMTPYGVLLTYDFNLNQLNPEALALGSSQTGLGIVGFGNHVYESIGSDGLPTLTDADTGSTISDPSYSFYYDATATDPFSLSDADDSAAMPSASDVPFASGISALAAGVASLLTLDSFIPSLLLFAAGLGAAGWFIFGYKGDK